jgi:prepilin peptidase CpaA
MHPILAVILAIAALWAVYTDLRYRRISNVVTFGAAVAGITVRAALGGPSSALTGAEGWALGVGLLLLPFVLGWMGAGDVKLLAAFGAIGGPIFVLQSALLGCLLGGIMSLFYLAREGKLWFTFRFLPIYIRHPLGSVLETKRRMPFGPALALGSVAAVFLTGALV